MLVTHTVPDVRRDVRCKCVSVDILHASNWQTSDRLTVYIDCVATASSNTQCITHLIDKARHVV